MALALRERREFLGLEIVVERDDGSRWCALAYANPFFDDQGKLLGGVNVLFDISDRKRSEEALRQAQQECANQLVDLNRLQAMSSRLATTLQLEPILNDILQTAAAIENTDMGLLALCDQEQTHLKIGASLGLAPEALRQLDYIPPGGGACGTAFFEGRRVMVEDTQTDPLFAPYREVARQAGFRAVHSTPLRTRAGRVIGVLSTHSRRPRRPTEREQYLLDVCARQAVDYIENARLYGQLQEAHRRKDEFLATLAHELRNPLAPIQNAAEIFHAQNTLGPALQWARDVIDRQVKHLARLVDDLLDLSRITVGKLELRRTRIDLKEVLRAALETSKPLLNAGGQQFQVQWPKQSIYLEGDLTRLAQVVANLLNNAAKYTDASGSIWCTADRQGSDAVISVRDTGIGIAPDLLPRVFEMFTQADGSLERTRGGLGIGLTLVQRLVHLHGGTVSVRSEGLGRGSEFTVRLPALIETPAAEPAAPSASAENGTAHPLRILVVDDNRDAAASLSMLLQLVGNQLRTAHDGRDALHAAAEFLPDVMLLDIGLPLLNGYEVAQAIRATTWGKSMVLIATTGWGQPEDRSRSLEAGFDYHLVKPVDPNQLFQLLTSVEYSPRTRGSMNVSL
jgi:signal transduction histidine kinase/ActR/RegA family two-component response regulator